MAEKIDRAKVLRFFTWSNRVLRPPAYCHRVHDRSKLGVVSGGCGCLRSAEKAWILLLTSTATAGFSGIAALLFVRLAVRGDKPLSEYHDEVKKAKSFDFAKVLIQSFRKTETALNNLLDFDQADPAASASDGFCPEDRQLLEALRQKAVCLPAGRGMPNISSSSLTAPR